MKSANLEELGASVAQAVDHSEGEPIVILREGQPVAVLLSLRSVSDLELLADRPGKLADVLADGWRAHRDGHSIDHASFWQSLETGGEA